MKKTHSLSILFTIAISTLVQAETRSTCAQDTKRSITCFTKEEQQVDVCKRKNGSFQIRINGEVYSQMTRKSHFDGLTRYQGKSTEGIRFILEINPKKKNGYMTEVNRYEMPIGESLQVHGCL